MASSPTTTSHTSWNLYATNEEAWEQMLEDCRNAKKSIDIEQFIFVADELGQKFIDICVERAAAGVKVRFLWDAAGSFTFWGSSIVDDLRSKGIELRFWKTLVPSYSRVPYLRSWFLRNHRRTLVIDRSIAYTGSMCIYNPMKNWRDTNVRLEGLVVAEMYNAFDRMWARATHQKPLPHRIRARDLEFRYITNKPRPGQRHIYSQLIDCIRGARTYIYITTPYFVPTHRLLRIIKLAAHRGVDVRIILPEKTDHYPTLDIAARSYFKTLLSSGVRIFLYKGNVIHSKSIVIDGEWSTVGSLNLDRVSLLYNFEANIITTNRKFTEELSAHFIHDMHESTEINYDEWKNRYFIERIPEMLIVLVRKFL